MVKKILFTATTLSLSTTFAADPSRIQPEGKVTYFGTGFAERAPEYGEVYFDFYVDCRPSVDAVREKISERSNLVWQTIISKVPPTEHTETERTYWSEISDIEPYDSTSFVDNGNHRRDSCTNQEIALNRPSMSFFRGSQRIGIRTANLDWLEALVLEVIKQNEQPKPGNVIVSTKGIDYAITQKTKIEMAAEVDKEAADQAMGRGSVYEVDRKTLNFVEAYFVGRREVRVVPPVRIVVGQAVKSGEAPPISLQLMMRYKFYIQASDLLSENSSNATRESYAEYTETGEAQTIADFAETTITLRSSCGKNEKDALEAIENKFQNALTLIKDFHGAKDPIETDGYTYSEPTVTRHSEYEPMKYLEFPRDGRPVITHYFDRCRSEIVHAEEVDHPNSVKYFQSQRNITVKSSHFSGLVKLVEDLLALNETNPQSQSVIVSASQPSYQITKATKNVMVSTARENAAQKMLNPGNSFRREAANQKQFGYHSAHLIGVEIESDSVVIGRSLPNFSASEAPSIGPEVIAENRDNKTRAMIPLMRRFAFDFEFLSKDFMGTPTVGTLESLTN